MTAQQHINRIALATEEGSISPSTISDAMQAILDEASQSGGGEIPADLTQRLDALGTAIVGINNQQTEIKKSVADNTEAISQNYEIATSAQETAADAQSLAADALAKAEQALETGGSVDADTSALISQIRNTANDAKSTATNAMHAAESAAASASAATDKANDAAAKAQEALDAAAGSYKHWVGTSEAYSALGASETDTIYLII